jgi:hypothetical protein
MSGITVRSAYGKLQNPSQDSKDLRDNQYITGQPVGSNRRSLDVFPLGVFEVSASSVVEAGSTNNLVKITAHGAKVGDIIRILSSANNVNEFEVFIDKVIDADNFELASILSANLEAGDTISILRPVSNKLTPDGTTLAQLNLTAIKFKQDGTDVEVEEDTVTPSNSVPLPVKLMEFGGDISISANQIDVNLDDTDDSVALGDGSGNLIDTLTSNTSTLLSLSVKDEDANASLTSLDGKTIEDAVVIASNSTTSPLGSGAVFTGAPFEILKYSVVNVGLISNVASATNGVKLEVSPDGINWDHSHSTTYSGGSGTGYIFNCEFKYARVVYTNGASAQSFFRLQTIVKKNFTKQSLYTIDQVVNGNMFVELGKNVIIGKSTAGGGSFVDVKVNPSGALAVEASLAAGTNNIGDVDVLTLPSIPAGNNNIGDVDIASMPSIPAGNNNIGDVDIASMPVSFNSGIIDSTTQRVVIASDQTVPISAASLPLPSGAATDAKLDTIITAIGNSNTKLDTIIDDNTAELDSTLTNTISGSVITFNPPAQSKLMIIQNSLEASSPIRFTSNSGTPSASNGYYLGIGQSTSTLPAGIVKVARTDASGDGDVTIAYFV